MIITKDNTNNIFVSVIMAVYNSEDTIVDALNSLLNQTHENFEIIICNDGSTDATMQILNSFKTKYPKKITLISNQENKFLPYSLNRCLSQAKGKYIVRMDADDISVENRIESLLIHMTKHPEIDLLGSYMRRFDGNKLLEVFKVPINPNRYTLRKKMPFAHATIMVKKEVYDELGGYTVSKRTKRSEDRDLYFRFYQKNFVGKNIDKPLYLVREDLNALKRRTVVTRYNSLLTTYIGFCNLNYPVIWYLRPTLDFVVKSIIPNRIFQLYRKIQFKIGEKSE